MNAAVVCLTELESRFRQGSIRKAILRCLLCTGGCASPREVSRSRVREDEGLDTAEESQTSLEVPGQSCVYVLITTAEELVYFSLLLPACPWALLAAAIVTVFTISAERRQERTRAACISGQEHFHVP